MIRVVPVLACVLGLAGPAWAGPFGRGAPVQELEMTLDLSPTRFDRAAPFWRDRFGGPMWLAGDEAPYVAAYAHEPAPASSWRAATNALIAAAGLEVKGGEVSECAWCAKYGELVSEKKVQDSYIEHALRTMGQSWVVMWVPTNEQIDPAAEEGRCYARSGVEGHVVWYLLGPGCL